MLSSTFSKSLLSALAVVSGLSLINQSVVGETTLYNTPYGNAYGSPIVAFIAPEPYLRFNDGKRIEYGVADYLNPAVVSIEGAGSGSGYGPSSAGTGTHSGTGWNSYHHGVDTEHISILPSSVGPSFYGVPAVPAVAPPVAASVDDAVSIDATDSKLKSAALPHMDTVILDKVTEKILVAEESNVTVVALTLADKVEELTSNSATEMPVGEGAKIVEVKTGETDFELPTATDTSDDSVVISLPEKENSTTAGGYGYGNGNVNDDGNGNEVGSGSGSGYGYGPSAAAVLLSSKSNDIGNDKENATIVEYGTPAANVNMAMPTAMPAETTSPRSNLNVSYGQPSGGYGAPVGPYIYLQQPQPQTVNLIPLETTNQILETVNDGQSEMTKIAIEIQIDNNTSQII